jgi:hypothetical protein
MAVRDAPPVNRHVFMTGHNDDRCGVRQALVELPIRALETRVNWRVSRTVRPVGKHLGLGI